MKYLAALSIMLLFASPAWSAPPQDPIANIRALIEAKQFEQALAYVDAELEKNPENVDFLLFKGNLHYYQEDYHQAEKTLQKAHHLAPDYTDITNALLRVRNTKWKSIQPPAKKLHQRLFITQSFSQLNRSSQSNWRDTDITYAGDINAHWTLLGGLEYYDRFDQHDTLYKAGAIYRFESGQQLTVDAGVNPDADIRPSYRGHAAFETPIGLGNERNRIIADGRLEHYRNSIDVFSSSIAMQYWLVESFALTPKAILVNDSENEKKLYGWSLKADLEPVDNWSFYLGYANAPETVDAATKDTSTLFLGTTHQLNESVLLKGGYSREDREQGFLRHEYTLGIGLLF